MFFRKAYFTVEFFLNKLHFCNLCIPSLCSFCAMLFCAMKIDSKTAKAVANDSLYYIENSRVEELEKVVHYKSIVRLTAKRTIERFINDNN